MIFAHRGAEAAFVDAAWPAKLASSLAQKSLDVKMVYMHTLYSIEAFIEEGVTSRALFYASPRRTKKLFSFHRLDELVALYLTRRFPWPA